MAKKFVLGKRPETFKEIKVKFVDPTGEETYIPVVYQYRTAIEFGKWLDDISAGMKRQESDSEVPGDATATTWESINEKICTEAADRLLTAISSWGIDLPLDRDALIDLASSTPAAVRAMLESYGLACREGRLGN